MRLAVSKKALLVVLALLLVGSACDRDVFYREHDEKYLTERTNGLREHIYPTVQPFEIEFGECGPFPDWFTYVPAGCGGDHVIYNLDVIREEHDELWRLNSLYENPFNLNLKAVDFVSHRLGLASLVDHEVAHVVRHSLYGWADCPLDTPEDYDNWISCVHEDDPVFTCIERSFGINWWDEHDHFHEGSMQVLPEDAGNFFGFNQYGWDGHSKIDVSHCAPTLVDN